MRKKSWSWNALFVLLIAALPGGVFASTDITPDNAQTGSLLLRMQDGYRVAMRMNTNVNMQINGLVARVSVHQEFRNDGNGWAEGVYVFPLPEGAAVDRMRLYIGERFIEGEIREKEQARKEYEQAKAAGKKASLVEQQRPNLFTSSIANIAPGEVVVVEIEYLENLRFDSGSFSIRFPLTLTPRYIPGAPVPVGLADREGSGWAASTLSVPDAGQITPPMVRTSTDHRVSMNISVNAGMPLEIIASRYHPVSVSETNGRYQLVLAGGTAPMDHDFELLWRPAPAAAPRAMAFTETIDGEPHYLLMLMPPSRQTATARVIPREMIFIVDTSGSMHGTSIAQAKQALRRALQGLQAGDRFNVIAFSSSPNPLFPAAVVADSRNLAFAENFVARLEANGGTEMRAALELALLLPPAETHLRQVIFITDGAVGNEEQLFGLIERRLGAGRLFTVGIGSAPNSWFMRKSAEVGRGTFTTISALHEVGEKMDRLFAKIAQPQISNITIDWPSGVVVDAYPTKVPDLYMGEPVTVKARIDGVLRPDDVVSISGDSTAGAWFSELPLSLDSPSEGIGALWARARIAHLMDEQRRSSDADEIKAVRTAIVGTALRHHLVSRYTSLIAIDKTPLRPANELQRQDRVPNRMAYGQSGNAIFGFPATATNAQQLIRLGLAFILAALSLALHGRREKCRVAAP